MCKLKIKCKYFLDLTNIKKALIELHSYLKDQLKATYDSIGYDVIRRLEQFENKIMLNIGRSLGRGLTEDLNKLEVNLPITKLGIFESFDISLSTKSEKEVALVR